MSKRSDRQDRGRGSRCLRWMDGGFTCGLLQGDREAVVFWLFRLAALWCEYQLRHHQHFLSSQGMANSIPEPRELRFERDNMRIICSGSGHEEVGLRFAPDAETDFRDVRWLVEAAGEIGSWREDIFTSDSTAVGRRISEIPVLVHRGILRYNAEAVGETRIGYLACLRVSNTMVGVIKHGKLWGVFGLNQPSICVCPGESLASSLALFQEECRVIVANDNDDVAEMMSDLEGHGLTTWLVEIERWRHNYLDNYSRRLRKAQSASKCGDDAAIAAKAANEEGVSA